MTKEKLMTSINQTASDLGILHWIQIKDVVFIPMAMSQLSAVMWVMEFKENENTKLIREQQKNLYLKGRMIFDD